MRLGAIVFDCSCRQKITSVKSLSLTELGAVLDTNIQVCLLVFPQKLDSISFDIFQHGLKGPDALRKLARDGRNQLTPPPETPWYFSA